MFHQFQATSPTPSSHNSRNNPKTRRQSTTTHACEECRRRKIRCDGKQPCSHCEWYKHPKLCKYSKKQPRVIPSQKLLDELNTSLSHSKRVIEQLFPHANLEQLGELPRSELIELINAASSQTPSSSTSPHTNSDTQTPGQVKCEDASVNLEALEQEPSPDANWDESKLGPHGIPHISDDVNALSMNVSRQSSYMGVSSIAAALRVISKINKALEHVIVGTPHRTNEATRSNSPRRWNAVEEAPTTISAPILAEHILVDAYFDHIHPLVPMIDENRFRFHYSQGDRKDPSWLALMYMVFAMGTIAASTAEDNSHLMYFQQAKNCIDLDMFGNGRIEALQALGLMGGLYLHYESRPNMANALMGAAMRMACALGLHREYTDGAADFQQHQQSRPEYAKRALLIPREVRRRTWWSLFCMDTWATTTTGRPSLGRISPAVTVQSPSFLGGTPDNANPGQISNDDAAVMILSYEITFCKIATRIQDRLAEQPVLPFDETARFDQELMQWYENLPPMFDPSEDCPRRAITPRAVMSWRYHNLRLVLHRPLLLSNALRSSLDHNTVTSPEEAHSVRVCRQIAVDTIDDIERQWRPTQISGWNAVWLLFQASMAPLVTLFAEYNRNNPEEVRLAQSQIERVITLLAKMADWSIAAKKTSHFMLKIYEHSRYMTAQASAQSIATAAATQQQLQGLSQLHMDEAYTHPQVLSIPTTTAIAPTPTTAAAAAMPPSYLQTQNHLLRSNAPSRTIPVTASFSQGLSTGGIYAGVNLNTNLNNAAAYSPGLSTNGVGGGGAHVSFMNQNELNAFWNQIMWGEGDIPEFMMDTTYEYDEGQYALHGHGAVNGNAMGGGGVGGYGGFGG